MIYRTFQDLKLSGLGMGCMRFPVLDDDPGRPDQQQVNAMVHKAMEAGVNYYDTAWGYHNGQSEIVLGKALKNYERSSFYLADKFPGYDVSNMDKVEEIFEKQLEKCQVSYFDFYLFHNVCEKNIDAYLDERYGILDYLLKQKENGRIRHLGFSGHGEYPVLERFLKAYGKHMEFCQLQINFVDWEFQKAKEKVDLLNQYQIPVWVMEPLRGGKLVSLDAESEQTLRSMRPGSRPVDWAFHFLQSLPEVCVVLSGMSNMQQLEDNLRIWDSMRPLDEEEMETLLNVARQMTSRTSVPCTACRYCTTYCPQGLDIPRLLSLYNEFTLTQGGFIAPMVLGTIDKEHWPTACIGCRSCEKVCPQEIKISEVMKTFGSKLGE